MTTVILLLAAPVGESFVAPQSSDHTDARMTLEAVVAENGGTIVAPRSATRDQDGGVYITIHLDDGADVTAFIEAVKDTDGVDAAFMKPAEELP